MIHVLVAADVIPSTWLRTGPRTSLSVRDQRRLTSAATVGMIVFVACIAAGQAADSPAPWLPLFNGQNLSNWDKWLGPDPRGNSDSKEPKRRSLGLNNDPLGVFTVVDNDGAPAIRVSGQVYGAITTREEFGDCHIRLEYKWGERKWPPRGEPRHYRDSGLLYWCVGEHGAGSGAWMRSVECNIMERGVGQWWPVAGTWVDVEGRKVVLEQEPTVPYRGESKGETCILWQPGGTQFTTSDGITSPHDPERAGQWNVCEVIAWGNVGIHLLNGEVVLVVTNPRFKEGGREVPLARGKIQLQSEGAELFYRKAEARRIDEIPATLLKHVPKSAPDERGFVSLFGKDAHDGWAQCGPGEFKLENGVATATGGMGLWWFTNRTFTNFVLRGEFVQEQDIADSGVFVRFPNPGNDPWVAVKRGHEFEIGDPHPEKPTWRTGSMYPFKASTKANTGRLGEWNTFEMVCVGHDYSVRLNNEVVTTWSDASARSASGYVGLQNYNDKKTVRFRNLRVKDLPPVGRDSVEP